MVTKDWVDEAPPLPKTKPMKLVGQLFDGPLDIIGDIHGEIDALESLLIHLGYEEDGAHPEGRRLVFVGDLVDRGPDSAGIAIYRDELGEGDRVAAIVPNIPQAVIGMLACAWLGAAWSSCSPARGRSPSSSWRAARWGWRRCTISSRAMSSPNCAMRVGLEALR